jgi:hypothetical protein
MYRGRSNMDVTCINDEKRYNGRRRAVGKICMTRAGGGQDKERQRNAVVGRRQGKEKDR